MAMAAKLDDSVATSDGTATGAAVTVSHDLRQELYTLLAAAMERKLSSVSGLSRASRSALLAVLANDAPTAAQVLAAVAKEDPSDGGANG